VSEEDMPDQAEPQSGEIVTERLIDAPRDLVFAAWVDPEQVVKWWGPDGFTNTIHEMDVRPGGHWRFVMHGPDGRDYQNHSVFAEVKPPERIVYDHVSTPKFRSTVTFADEGGKTRVVMRAVFENAEAFRMAVEVFHAAEGGRQTLGRLADFVAKLKSPTRKIVLFMHVSLDGFVAGADGALDWIVVDDEVFAYAGGRTNEGDMALYGRKTFEMMEAYWPTAAQNPGATAHDIEHGNWYNRVTKVVLSRTLKGRDLPRTKIVSENIGQEIAALKRAPGQDILVFGSPGAAQSLMAEDLIDDYWLFVNPFLLGSGIPLFRGAQRRSGLRLRESRALSSGVVCLHYERRTE
jgi:uncharacterized protein YndB with AHSA1/START domain/dihydrofolate reductase